MPKLLVAICCALCLVGCRPAPSEPTTGTDRFPLNVCYSSISAAQAPALYALDQGIYAEHGLDVNLVYVDGGSKAVTTLISGDMDICQVGGSAVVNAAAAGEDLALIAGLFNRYSYALMVAPEINTPEDLRGKALAISSPGSSSDSALRSLLPTLGLEADEDVAILAIGGQSARLAAMESGSVAGALISVPETVKASALGYRELANMLQSDVPYPHNAIATSRTLIEGNREAVKRFLRATVTSIDLMKADKRTTIEVVARYLQLDVEQDAAALEEAYQVFVVGGLADIPYPTAEGVQRQLDALVDENPKAAQLVAADVIDASLLGEIEREGPRDDRAP